MSFKPYYNWNTFNTKIKSKLNNTGDWCFKPYYNWNTFNTTKTDYFKKLELCFKPYYNWNTFNTLICSSEMKVLRSVLNLIITGIPSIPFANDIKKGYVEVLNLIITGIPSIPEL